MFYTYILECSDKTYYTGWTTDLERRLSEHNSGKGAKYTRGRTPVYLKIFWVWETKSEAMKFESLIKKLSRQDKEKLITGG